MAAGGVRANGPTQDASQDYTQLSMSESTSGGGPNAVTTTTCSFRRALDTGDPNDVPIVPGSMYLLWAWHTADGDRVSRSYAKHAGGNGAVAVEFIPSAVTTTLDPSMSTTTTTTNSGGLVPSGPPQVN